MKTLRGTRKQADYPDQKELIEKFFTPVVFRHIKSAQAANTDKNWWIRYEEPTESRFINGFTVPGTASFDMLVPVPINVDHVFIGAGDYRETINISNHPRKENQS